MNKLCQHIYSPSLVDTLLLKWILCYIKGTLYYGILIIYGLLHLITYLDVDWVGDTINQWSTINFCIFLGLNLISWKMTKQKTIAWSSIEAKYRALATTIIDVIWIWCLLHEFDISTHSLTSLHCNNSPAIALAFNPIFCACTKHVEIDFYFVRNYIKYGVILLHHINSTDQTTDIFTKSFPISCFHQLCSKLTITSEPINL